MNKENPPPPNSCHIRWITTLCIDVGQHLPIVHSAAGPKSGQLHMLKHILGYPTYMYCNHKK